MTEEAKKPGETSGSESLAADGSALPAITGYIHFNVTVDCPHCDNDLDLTMHPFDDLDTYGELGAALFGGYDTPAKRGDVNIEYECTHCGKNFLLGKLEH